MNYCRYCAYCFQGDENDFRCSDHPKGLQPHWTREQINRPTNCPNFALSDLGDVETGKMYHPHVIRSAKCAPDANTEQIRMNFDS